VLNLVPNKPRAYAECYRILKPGGRLAISDIAFKEALPAALACILCSTLSWSWNRVSLTLISCS
jgi:arsenite methyltransferase